MFFLNYLINKLILYIFVYYISNIDSLILSVYFKVFHHRLISKIIPSSIEYYKLLIIMQIV